MKLIRTLAALLLAVVFLCAPAIATEATEAAMTFEEFLGVATTADLLNLRDELDAAIRASDVWESVNVPSGLYRVGVDIPAGKWTIEAGTTGYCRMRVGDVLEDTGKEIDIWESTSSYSESFKNEYGYDDIPILQRSIEIIDLPHGYYVEVSDGSVLFTPYYGKPNFIFYADETPDEEISHEFPLEGLTYDELIVLKDQINPAIWNSYNWDRVLVPYGMYEVGVDIPAGRWDIEAPEASSVYISYGKEIDDESMDTKLAYGAWNKTVYSEHYAFYDEGDLTKTDIDAASGFYIDIYSSVYAWFSPHKAGGGLGFKAFGGGTGTGGSNTETPASTANASDTVMHDGEEYARLDYEQNARNPLLYTDKKIFFSGEIIQVVDGDYYTAYRVDVNGDIVLVYRFGASSLGRFLVDDKVTVYGTSLGVETYETVLGSMVTVPSCFATEIILEN